MKKVYTALLLSALSITSFAKEVTFSDFYISASIGQADYDVSKSNISIHNGVRFDSFENKDTSFKILGGYELNEFISFELGYANLGNITSSQSGTITRSNNWFDTGYYSTSRKVDGFVINGVLSYPMTDSFSVYSKVGAFAWTTDSYLLTKIQTDTGGNYIKQTELKSNTDDTDLFYGVGASYRWSNLTFHLEYEFLKLIQTLTI